MPEIPPSDVESFVEPPETVHPYGRIESANPNLDHGALESLNAMVSGVRLFDEWSASVLSEEGWITPENIGQRAEEVKQFQRAVAGMEFIRSVEYLVGGETPPSDEGLLTDLDIKVQKFLMRAYRRDPEVKAAAEKQWSEVPAEDMYGRVAAARQLGHAFMSTFIPALEKQYGLVPIDTSSSGLTIADEREMKAMRLKLGLMLHDVNSPLNYIGLGLQYKDIDAQEAVQYVRQGFGFMQQKLVGLREVLQTTLTYSEIDVDSLISTIHECLAPYESSERLYESEEQQYLPIDQLHEEGIVVPYSEELLASLFDNFTDNAWKVITYENIPDVKIWVGYRLLPDPEGETVEFVIDNNGTGFPAEMIDEKTKTIVFQFGLSLWAGRKDKGTGFAMALHQEMAKVFKGQLIAENLPDGKGTRFRLQLPIKRVLTEKV